MPWQRTLFVCCVAQLISISAFSALMPFMPFYVRYLGVEGQDQVSLWSGISITATGLTLTIFAPIWGILSDRFGRKIMVTRAMFGGAVVLFSMGLVRNIYQFVALRALQGCLTGTMVASTTLVASIAPKDRLAWSLGIIHTAVLTGASLGPWMGGVVADNWGYRMPFYVSGVLLLVGGLMVALGAHERFERKSRKDAPRRGLTSAFGVYGLVAILSVFFFISFSRSFVHPIFPLFVEEIAAGYRPATVSGMLMGLMGMAAGVSAMVIGRLSDRVGHRRVLIGTTLSYGLMSFPQALAQNLPQLAGFWIAKGFAAGGAMPAMYAVIGSTAPAESYGRAYGFCHAVSSMGMATGPLAGAYLSTHVGLRWPFAIMGFLMMLVSALVYMLLRPEVMKPAAEDRPGPDEDDEREVGPAD